MTKALLRGQLQTIKNNFSLTQLGIALMAQPDALERFNDAVATLQDHPEVSSFEYIRYVYGSDDLLKSATAQLRNSVLRNCLKETFELVLAYGKATNQEAAIKAAPWFPFLRIVRNCLSHDMQLHFNAHALKQLPVTWSGLTIDQTMQNSPLPAKDFLSRAKALELMNEVITYVEGSVA
jgi:hypothetical protein